MPKKPHGWSAKLIPRCRAVVDAFKEWLARRPIADLEIPQLYAWDELEGGDDEGSSDNHEAQAWGVELARSALWGTQADYEDALRVWRHCLMLEREHGWWRGEQMAADDHAMQHLAGHVCATIGIYVGGRRHGGSVETSWRKADREQDAWWSAGWALCEAGMPLPGARQPNGPSLEPLEQCDRLRRGQKVKGALRKPANWLIDYYAFADGLRSLISVGAVPDDAGSALPKLRSQLTIYRGDGWHAATVEPTHGARAEWCRWCYVQREAHDRGQKPLAGVEWGHDAPDPRRVEEWRANALRVVRTP